MSYLSCPDCRLTVPAAAYYLRGDECPRCLATMEKRPTFRAEPPTRTDKLHTLRALPTPTNPAQTAP